MLTKQMRRAIVLLVLVSATIYALQIFIFKDPSTTAFYLFQDMAFIPISVALTTFVLGAFLDEKERRERVENTRMLTSTFFTQIGASLMTLLINHTENRKELHEIISSSDLQDSSVKELQARVRALSLKVSIDEESCTEIMSIIRESQMSLLVLSSNPMILEQKDFTNLLWGIFHLEDEFRLRGDYQKMSGEDRAHINDDLSKVLQLLMLNSIPNSRYLRDTYPNFYASARSKAINSGKQ